MAGLVKASKASVAQRKAELKVDKNWEQAVGTAIKKKRPAEGWPKPEKKK